MSEEPELLLHPAEQIEMTRMDRELILAMSKAIVSIASEQQAPGFGFKYAAELAEVQNRYRQRFFPETIEP